MSDVSSNDNDGIAERAIVIPLLLVSFFANLWTFLLVVIPVVVTLQPTNYYPGHDNWFGGNDVMRIIEPLAILPYMYIFIVGYNKNIHGTILLLAFAFATYLYILGAGFHTASNMFKNAVESEMNDDTGKLDDLYYWMRTIWEHDVSHYMYGTGLALIFVLQTIVHKNEILTEEPKYKIRIIVFLTAIVRGLLIAGACIEFPAGVIVGFVYLPCVFILSTLYTFSYQFNNLNWISDFMKTEMRPMCMSFLWSYVVALIILIFWSCIIGIKTRSQSGL